MDYLWLKSIHVIAMVIWVGGMLAVAIILSISEFVFEDPDARLAILGAIRRWDHKITTPAMLLTWAAGLALALWGRWFPSAWLIVKLCFVLGLSGLHGLLAGSLRRQAGGDAAPLRIVRYAPTTILAALAFIVILVICKPI